MQRTVTKLHIHIRDLIPDRPTILDFSSYFIISLYFFNNKLNSFFSLYMAITPLQSFAAMHDVMTSQWSVIRCIQLSSAHRRLLRTPFPGSTVQ